MGAEVSEDVEGDAGSSGVRKKSGYRFLRRVMAQKEAAKWESAPGSGAEEGAIMNHCPMRDAEAAPTEVEAGK